MAQLTLASIRRASPHSWIEGFAGSAAVALHLMGGESPTGYAGNKRFPAPRLVSMLWPYSGMPQNVILAEVGPWRTVWEVFSSRSGGGRILDIMLGWPQGDDRQLWYDLVSSVPSSSEEFAAVYLFVQARQAHHAPIWVRSNEQPTWVSRGNGGKSESHPNHRPEPQWKVYGGNGGASKPGHHHANDPRWTRAGGSGGESAPSHRAERQWVRETGTYQPSHHAEASKVPGRAWGEALSRQTLINRVRGLLSLPWERVTVVGDYREAVALARPGDIVYLDPPYVDASVRYPQGPPTDLEHQARITADRGVSVAISEGKPLELLTAEGWQARDITTWFRGKREPGSEWLTYRLTH